MEYKYTAIIVEPRKHKALEFVLQNICDCLSKDWKVILFHGINNIEYSQNISEKLNNLNNNRIHLVNLNIDNLNLISYSKIFASKNTIYDYIDTELFLVFQTDSMIIKKNAYLINNYLNYDYVGSPWKITNYIPTQNCNFIGNGGFSLRRKSKMIEIIEKIQYNDNHEDLYFSNNYEPIIYVKKPEYKIACNFCVEEVFSELTFAFHKCWLHDHYNKTKDLYPEIEILEKLQEVEE